MSDFADIAEAYRRRDAANSWGDVNYGLVYTCNCGWVDLGHLNPTNTRRNIGAANLWNQVNAEGAAAQRTICEALDMRGTPHLSVPGKLGDELARYIMRRASGCDTDPYFRFDDGQTGYLVRYRQDHGGHPGKPGAGGSFVVKHGLTLSEKRSVALTIFMEVSRKFEDFQSSWLGRQVTDSGYSQEDLVSNLIGFYIGIGLVEKDKAISECHPVSRATSEAVWNSAGPVGENKNRTFEPQFQSTGREDDAAQMCVDDCVGQPRALPATFRKVRPAAYGVNFFRLREDALFEL